MTAYSTTDSSPFARRVFLGAGIYGIIALLPLYALETKYAPGGPVALTRPEFLYGFAGVAIAWQLAFIAISRDVARFRPLIIPAIAEKLSFGIAALVLFGQGRLGVDLFAGGIIDLVLATLFAVVYFRTAPSKNGAEA
jgi:hypothetical protein